MPILLQPQVCCAYYTPLASIKLKKRDARDDFAPTYKNWTFSHRQQKRVEVVVSSEQTNLIYRLYFEPPWLVLLFASRDSDTKLKINTATPLAFLLLYTFTLSYAVCASLLSLLGAIITYTICKDTEQ